MTTISARTPRTTDIPRLADPDPRKIAFVAAMAAVPPITVVHVEATARMDPVGWTISDYVISAPHGVGLYAMTAGALAVGGLALARGLRGRPGTTLVRSLLRLWAVAVAVTAVFPTNIRGTRETLSSNVHLIAGAVVFAALPLAAWMLSRSLQSGPARGTASRWLQWSSSIAGALSVFLILNRLPGVLGVPGLMLPPGVLQRTAGAALIILLALAALTAAWAGTSESDQIGPSALIGQYFRADHAVQRGRHLLTRATPVRARQHLRTGSTCAPGRQVRTGQPVLRSARRSACTTGECTRPSSLSISSSGIPLVSGITRRTQINWPTMQIPKSRPCRSRRAGTPLPHQEPRDTRERPRHHSGEHPVRQAAE